MLVGKDVSILKPKWAPEQTELDTHFRRGFSIGIEHAPSQGGPRNHLDIELHGLLPVDSNTAVERVVAAIVAGLGDSRSIRAIFHAGHVKRTGCIRGGMVEVTLRVANFHRHSGNTVSRGAVDDVAFYRASVLREQVRRHPECDEHSGPHIDQITRYSL